MQSAQITFIPTCIRANIQVQYLVWFWDIPFYTKDIYERHLRASEIVTLINKLS